MNVTDSLNIELLRNNVEILENQVNNLKDLLSHSNDTIANEIAISDRFLSIASFVFALTALLIVKGTERSVYNDLHPKISQSLWNIISYTDVAQRAPQNETFTWV